MTGAEKGARWWTIAVFAIALSTRLLWISVPLNVDEGLWMRRGSAFLKAVVQGQPADTYQRHHPGVTNMWLIGGAVASRYMLRGMVGPPPSTPDFADDLARQSASLPDYLGAVAALPVVPLVLHSYARVGFALVTAACMAGFFALSWRLFGATVALIAAAILLLEPFYLGYQRFVTTDGNQSNFTWLALLTFLLYLRAVTERPQRARLRWLLLSGLFFGLALLSKVSAMLSLPVFVLAAAWWAWRLRSRHALLQLVLGLLAWALVAVAVTVVLWPSLWVDLPGTVMQLSKSVGVELDGHIQFFLGQTVVKPGLAFYPVVLLYRLSPLLLLGTVLGLICLGLPSLRRHLRDSASLAVIVLDLVIVFLALSSVDTKLDRYIVPLVPGMALVAASGISAIVSYLGETRRRGDTRTGRQGDTGDAHRVTVSPSHRVTGQGVALTAVLVIQLATALPHAPYYVTYFNPLAGGPRQAQKLLMIGNGELLDRAAAWLGEHGQDKDATVATWYRDSFGPYYGGLTVPLSAQRVADPDIWGRANFVVLYINMMQRNWPAQVVEYFGFQPPLYEVRAHGLDYVRVYPGPSVRDADLAKAPNRVDLNFQGNARLLGYDLETPEVPAGQAGVLTLYWQALEPFPAPDFAVRLGIKDADGSEWGMTESVPIGGLLPVDQWQQGQILRDVHQVIVPPGTPPGGYDLELSFWSPALQRALEIRDNGTSLGPRVSLTKLRVTQPANPPEPAADETGRHGGGEARRPGDTRTGRQ